jgi:ADP-ribose pyrophosphatase YjhB (NUDIX family)
MSNENIRHRATGIIKRDGKILLFRRIKPGHDYYMFPGGGVEKDETVEEALERELREELEIEIKKFKPLFVVEDIQVPSWATIHNGNLQKYYYF